MKIGVDIRSLLGGQYSGVPNFTYNLLKEILIQDTDNEYVFFYNSFRERKIPDFKAKNLKIQKYKIPNKILNHLFFGLLNRPFLDKLLGVDVFYLPNMNFVSLSPSCKKVVTIHDLSFWRDKKFFSIKQNLWHKMVSFKKKLNYFDKVVAVSEHTKKDIMEFANIQEDKISVVYPGLSQVQNEESIEMTKQKYNLPDKFILFLGTLEPRKNIDGLINAFERLQQDKSFSDLYLVIAGSKGWSYQKIFKIHNNSVYRHKIKFIGFVPEESKFNLYRLAKVFVYPSFYEGFGFPPLEAMSVKTPVIASTASSLPEIISDTALLIDPYSNSDMTESLKLVLQDKHLRDKIVEKSYKRVKNFSWQKAAQEYLSIFS